MKAVWNTCARAFSLPGLANKRGREEDVSDVLPEKKKIKAKVGRPEKLEVDDTQIPKSHQVRTNAKKPPIGRKTLPETRQKPPKSEEGREGLFSSLPLTLFSPSAPPSTIDLFISNGGLALPRLGPMEWQHHLHSRLNETHPFYHVDLIFVTGPDDLLGMVLEGRVFVLHNQQWVVDCVDRTKLLDKGMYVVDFPSVNQVGSGMEGQEDEAALKKEDGRNTIPNPHTSSLSKTTGPETQLSSHLLRYAQRNVDPMAFTSESALRDASFNRPSTNRETGQRASTASIPLQPRKSDATTTNAVAGSSGLNDGPQEPSEATFIPFDHSSQRVSSERSPTPQLYVPYKSLDGVKVEAFEERMKKRKVHDLEDFYQVLMECGQGNQVIMELEAGLLR